MQEAEWVMDGFMKCPVVGERTCRFSIEKLVDCWDLQQSHGTLLQEVLHQRQTGLLVRFDPDIAFCCSKNSHGSFAVVLGRQEQGLYQKKNKRVSR